MKLMYGVVRTVRQALLVRVLKPVMVVMQLSDGLVRKRLMRLWYAVVPPPLGLHLFKRPVDLR